MHLSQRLQILKLLSVLALSFFFIGDFSAHVTRAHVQPQVAQLCAALPSALFCLFFF